ncbi:ligand-gated channel [Photorhabdus heterorhabditis]|uniref:Ligand-gated channel n=1 Tax=Photorhabdus heterorhabditis TaxID=880156 RepID=A0ABR5KE79_9GAMM|nr:TonB-dependent receptor [Photorhabdus heterorhabditis]KOY62858.1 ligand-gated channel [Photorhabdus heterorhabditis]
MLKHGVTTIAVLSVFYSHQSLANKNSKTDSLDTIVVTAEKVSADQQKTAIGMTVLSDFDVERKGIENFYEVVSEVPNLYMIKAGNPSDAGFISLRGVTPGMEGEQSVGFFTDGVYSHSFDTELLDIERIEVLRGPQATLYGRNTEAGVINIITKDPDPVTERKLGFSYGSYNRLQTTAILGGGIDEYGDWSYRTALRYLNSDGYFKRDYDNKKNINNVNDFNGRFKLRWQPSDGPWDIITTFDAQNRRNGNASFAPIDKIKRGTKSIDSDYAGKSDANIYKGSIKAVYQWDRMDLTSISAYTSEDKKDYQDLDFTRKSLSKLLIDRKQDYFSQELRLNSKNTGPFNWLVGMYYFNQDDKLDIDYRMLPVGYQIKNTNVKTNNYALFGNTSYYLMDNVELVAGLRYDYEKKDLKFRKTENFSGITRENLTDNLSFDAWLPKAGVNYYATDNAMLYASIARGYKSGGFNSLAPKDQRRFDAEYTTNYEIGLKSEWLDKTVRWNTALFWIDFTDQQVEKQFYPESVTQNAGKSISRGLESEISWRVIKGLTLSANAGFNDAHFTEFKDNIYDKKGSKIVGVTDYKDKRPANTPNYTYGVGVDYSFLDGYFIRADYNVAGKVYFDNANTEKQSNYGLLNLRAGYETPTYDITLWAKNLLNKTYVTRAFPMDNPMTGENGWYGRAGEPLTFGATFNVKF